MAADGSLALSEPVALNEPTGSPAPAVVARIRGEPLSALPVDLYIPPDALEIFLETFEGPLDLLLYLIRRANIDILDIPMAPLTAQYLIYVEAMQATRLELAAEYLLMAATLLDIKSRMLLPKPQHAATDQDDVDPRVELVRRLVEYERTKRGAALLDQLPRVERDFEWVSVDLAETLVERLPEVSVADLQTVWLLLVRRARLTRHHQIQREELSVREYMTDILRRLRGEGGEIADIPFDRVFDVTHGIAGLIVSFLAVLELVKEGLVLATQSAPLELIYVRLNTRLAA